MTSRKYDIYNLGVPGPEYALHRRVDLTKCKLEIGVKKGWNLSGRYGPAGPYARLPAMVKGWNLSEFIWLASGMRNILSRFSTRAYFQGNT